MVRAFRIANLKIFSINNLLSLSARIDTTEQRLDAFTHEDPKSHILRDGGWAWRYGSIG